VTKPLDTSPSKGFAEIPAAVEFAPGESAHPIRVRYAESDQMGFSYYANYVIWFEVGRTEWMRAKGCTYRSLEDEGYLLPVTEAYCRYQTPARYDDLVYVITRVAKLSRVQIRFEYRLVRDDGTPLATGHTEHCFLSKEGRPLRAPEVIREAVAAASPAASD
jgi:acyl-CoA thioester hydrolase